MTNIPEYPGDMLLARVTFARVNVKLAMALLRNYGDHEAIDSGAIREEIIAENDRVHGNRSGASAVTWSDARLMLAATLRKALEELEG